MKNNHAKIAVPNAILDHLAIRLEDCRENFRDDDGNPFVVRCPKCKRENWAMAVASGQCSWCGWSEASKVVDNVSNK